jgi:hypothetical protein
MGFVVEMTNCILVKAYLSTNGYGYLMINNKSVRAHRGTWIKNNGPFPKGMVVDHICHNEASQLGKCEGGITCSHRACINLDHLRLVSQQENIMAGLHNIDNRNHCNQGHLFEGNIMVRKNGKRECAECNRVRARANYAKKVG